MAPEFATYGPREIGLASLFATVPVCIVTMNRMVAGFIKASGHDLLEHGLLDAPLPGALAHASMQAGSRLRTMGVRSRLP